MVRKTLWNGKNVYVLSNKILTLLVNPEDGMNIYDVIYHDISIIKWDEERYQKKLTYGIPVLYPTPNRVEQNEIHFAGDTFEARMHGLVRNCKFKVVVGSEDADSFELNAYLEWNEKEAEEFFMFPFESRLEIQIALNANVVSYQYKVINKGNKPLPYGFGIHPFFHKLGKQTKVLLPKGRVVEAKEKLPTGKKVSAAPGLFKGINVMDINLDHVFIDCSDTLKAKILYDDFQINLKATKEFDYVVVYTPDQDFFCIENQTCATNAHNLYEKGFEKESGLIIVEPGKSNSGRIWLEFMNE